MTTFVYSINSLESVDKDGIEIKNIPKSEITSYFQIDSHSGNITVTRSLDTEDIFRFLITVTASDGVNSDLDLFYINVCEENDNNPMFSLDTYTWTVEENSNIGTLVDTLQAQDIDKGSVCSSDSINVNDNVIYYYSDGVTAFNIAEQTGVVTVNQLIDYEQNQNFTLQIVAEDQGVPQLNGTTTVIINVIDLNDNNPQFDMALYNDSILEDVAVGVTLGTVIKALDADSGNNSIVRYKITEGIGKDDWELDSIKGTLKSAKIVRQREYIYIRTNSSCL